MAVTLRQQLRTNSNIAFQCAFHVVWCFEYRRRVLGGRIETRLKELIREVIAEKGAWLVELEVMPDHVHLLVEVGPTVRDPQAGQGHQGPLFPRPASGVPEFDVETSDAVDHLLLRGHRGRGTCGCGQAIRREPEEPVIADADRT